MAKDVKFTILMPPELKNQLIELAKKRTISQGAIVRQAVKALWLMDCKSMPTCATGAACPVPHMHGDPAAANKIRHDDIA